MVLSETQDSGTVITLLPNRSASWQETRVFLLLVAASTLAISLFWVSMGVWAVLPFYGLESGLLAFLMYRVSYASHQRQKITVGKDQVLIQCGVNFPRRSWSLRKDKACLAVIQPLHPLDPPALSIFDLRYNVEVGRFLNKEDKELALREFRRAGLFVRSHDKLGQALF